MCIPILAKLYMLPSSWPESPDELRYSVGGTLQLDEHAAAPVSKLLGWRDSVVYHIRSLCAGHVFKVYARSLGTHELSTQGKSS